MDFLQFIKEWKDAMVYNPSEFDFDEAMHEYYAEYQMNYYDKGQSVAEFCDFFFAEFDLDTHPYMIKSKAINTKHGNRLKKIANQFRRNNGLPETPLID